MDPAYLKYVDYFRKHPSTQEYYYRIGTEKSASAKELSKKMGLSIQTVTNALKELEKIGLLKSVKNGRVRIYTLSDQRLFKGLSSQRFPYWSAKRKEDVISTSVFKQNMEFWLKYLADIMEGTVYQNAEFKTGIISPIKIDFVIENSIGQTLFVFFNFRNRVEIEASAARILSLVMSKEYNPNLRVITAIGLFNEDKPPATSQESGAETDLLNFASSTFDRLDEASAKFEVTITKIIEKVLPGDVEKTEFAEKLSGQICRAQPYFGNSALPGEVPNWVYFDRIGDRRDRAFKAIQNKLSLNPKHRWLISPNREILSRDAAFRQVLYPQSILSSLGLKSGHVFVDEGCFEGLFTIAAAKIVGEKGVVIGVEVSPKAVAKLKIQAEQEKLPNVKIVNNFPEKAVLELKIADIVFFGAVLYEMFNPLKTLENAHSILKDSGNLIILEWTGRNLTEKPPRHGITDAPIGPPFRERLDREFVEEMVRAAGFEIQSIKEEGFYLYSIIAIKSSGIKKE
jgi:SAM-dependent methyltransferase/DNA-binding transcriptional ArsR family regulator